MIIKKLEINRTVLDLQKLPRGLSPEFAVVGRSNVGKSSLLNALFNRKKLARVSKDPGKTRTINFYMVNDRFFMVDLPGYGFAKISRQERQKWRILINEYLRTREQLRGVIQLIHAADGPTDDDIEMLTRLSMHGRDFVVALTKSDKVRASARKKIIRSLEGSFENAVVCDLSSSMPMAKGVDAIEGSAIIPATFFSAKTKEGRDILWKWIESRLE